MLTSNRNGDGYNPLANDENETNRPASRNGRTSFAPSNDWRSVLVAVTIAVIIAISLVAFWRDLPSQTPTMMSETLCTSVALRQEWRSLRIEEKQAYIEAVNCLRDQPSRLGLNQSLYDDFPYTHARTGVYSHYSAAFVAWHRYFIHVYEQALRDVCSYSGHLTYWDWTLDWEDFSTAPIWSEKHFGGDGDPSEGEEILDGYCVTTGPFAHLHVEYLEENYHPHCLSRGFVRNLEELAVHRASYSPQAIDQILHSKSFDDFNFQLEDGPHNTVPRSIRGDFANYTAPADPVFYLHHTQLDRLWWRWQTLHPSQLNEYLGSAGHNSASKASVQDTIPMGGLAPDISVAEILNTQGGMLCYRY